MFGYQLFKDKKALTIKKIKQVNITQDSEETKKINITIHDGPKSCEQNNKEIEKNSEPKKVFTIKSLTSKLFKTNNQHYQKKDDLSQPLIKKL